MESTFSGAPLDAAPYFLANRRGVVHGRIQRCHDCGFIFTNPQFSADEYDEIYKNAPGPDGSKIDMEEGDTRRFRRLAENVRMDVAGITRFLDFGCGRGGFLRAMNDPGGVGFEVGEPGVFMVGPSHVTTGNFLDDETRAAFDIGGFDLITAFDVFEHLPHLEKYVELLSSLLKPQGFLVVTVPDVSSWNARLADGRWNMYLLEHLWYFNRKTLRTFMQQAGYRETRHRILPYDAPLAHIARRAAQTYGISLPELGSALSRVVLPVPIGLMYCVFQREN
jgi:2-polyprenyl-3-methyl-5-hydroxy-6-metoxy-1,4-benzoquinol methylase